MVCLRLLAYRSAFFFVLGYLCFISSGFNLPFSFDGRMGWLQSGTGFWYRLGG